MAVAVPSREEGAVVPSPVTAAEAAALGADDVLARLRTGTGGRRRVPRRRRQRRGRAARRRRAAAGKDLDVLADGVTGGRRIFANTMKYVLMGTSSNFGNMFSAAGASVFLTFLPMLPSQILLNNLLYDSSQLAIPTDEVDPEQVAQPTRWDVNFIRRFMLFFGPISSVFNFITSGVMLWVSHAGPALFRSGWFVESLATQTLVIFAIRTRRVPFFRSRPSVPLLMAALGVVTAGAVLPF